MLPNLTEPLYLKTKQNMTEKKLKKMKTNFNNLLEMVGNTPVVKINNIDMTIISQRINISSKRSLIEENISKLLNFNTTNINLKGKSVDNLGIIGNNEASAALVSISLKHA